MEVCFRDFRAWDPCWGTSRPGAPVDPSQSPRLRDGTLIVIVIVVVIVIVIVTVTVTAAVIVMEIAIVRYLGFG